MIKACRSRSKRHKLQTFVPKLVHFTTILLILGTPSIFSTRRPLSSSLLGLPGNDGIPHALFVQTGSRYELVGDTIFEQTVELPTAAFSVQEDHVQHLRIPVDDEVRFFAIHADYNGVRFIHVRRFVTADKFVGNTFCKILQQSKRTRLLS